MSYLGFDYFSAVIVAEIKNSPIMEHGQVYDYAATQFDAYPAVVVTSSNLHGEFADNQRNTYHFSYSILCFMSRGSSPASQQQAEITMRWLVDDITTRLNNNPNINGTQSTFGKPISVQWGYAKAPEPDMRVATLNLEIEVAQTNPVGGGVLYTNNNQPLLT